MPHFSDRLSDEAGEPTDYCRSSAEVCEGVNMAAGTGVTALGHLRIVDFSRVLAVPLATMILGDLGADIVKVEHRAGVMTPAPGVHPSTRETAPDDPRFRTNAESSTLRSSRES